MDKQKALEIAKDRIKTLRSFVPTNESEVKISKETMEFLEFVKEMLNNWIMKYPELTGDCKNCLYGCYRLEDPNFKGTDKCEYKENGLDMCKKIIEGIQMKL